MVMVTDKEKQIHWDIPLDNEMIVVERLESVKSKPVYDMVKRLFDIVVSFIAIVVSLIPMIIIAIAISADSPGNPIYSQVRLGKNEKPFTLYKFRSMRNDAEDGGMRWAVDNDPRITRIGQILRKSRLDELPQFINIFLGQMSFVGPRPERPEFYDIFDTYIDGFRQRMLVKPGLTGLAQVNGGYDLLPEEKIIYDLEYIRNRSFLMDLKCIWKTIAVVFFKRGAR